MPTKIYTEEFLAKRRKWWVHHLWKAEAYAVENGDWISGIIQNRWVGADTCFITCTFTGFQADHNGVTHILGARLYDTDGDLAVIKNCDVQVLDSEYLLFRFELPIRELVTDLDHAEIKSVASTNYTNEVYGATTEVRSSGDLFNSLTADDYVYTQDSYNSGVMSLSMRKRGASVNRTLNIDGNHKATYNDQHLNTTTLRVYDLEGTPLTAETDYTFTYDGTALTITMDDSYTSNWVNILCDLVYTVDIVLDVVDGEVTLHKSDLYRPVEEAVITNPSNGEVVECDKAYVNGVLTLSNITGVNKIRLQCSEEYDGN